VNKVSDEYSKILEESTNLGNSEEMYKRKFLRRTVKIKFTQCNWDNAEGLFMDRLRDFMDKLWASFEPILFAQNQLDPKVKDSFKFINNLESFITSHRSIPKNIPKLSLITFGEIRYTSIYLLMKSYEVNSGSP